MDVFCRAAFGAVIRIAHICIETPALNADEEKKNDGQLFGELRVPIPTKIPCRLEVRTLLSQI
eukprot:SAG31_NODE_7744_length_1605_cov_1.568393_2_plen_62_part_01